MSDVSASAFTGVFRLDAGGEKCKVVKRRRRQILSCSVCRARKLKCDRQTPCGTCVKRGDEASCRPATGPQQAEKLKSDAHVHLQRLEEVVRDHLQANTTAQNGDGLSAETLTLSPGLSPQTAVPQPAAPHAGPYFGATHWSAILESIHDIKSHLESSGDIMDEPSPPSTSESSLGLALGSADAITTEEVLRALPPRPIADQLLSIYFSARFPAVPFLHSHKFQRECQAFWDNPSAADFLWISMLFSTLSTGAMVALASGASAALQVDVSTPATYLARAAECLTSGQYLYTRQYSVEALLLYTHFKFLQTKDLDPVLWTLFGVATRLAQRMGYHRDPGNHSARITPFDGEMRRRSWYFIETFDILFSFQLGIPAIIHEDECDTRPPRNLLDGDFDEDSQYIPSSRPDTDPTPILAFCYKSRLVRLFRRVVRLVLSPVQSKDEDTSQLDAALRKLHDEKPPSLRSRPVRAASFTDHTSTIMHRLMIELMHLKSLCILHRGSLTQEKGNPSFDWSREVCRTAAMNILSLHMDFHQESKLGRRLYGDRWVLSSLSLHDFLLAAMILCLDILETTSSVQDRANKLDALKSAHNMWSELAETSRDAARATRLIAAMITKVSGQDQRAPTHPAARSSLARPSPDQTELLINELGPGLGDCSGPPQAPSMPMLEYSYDVIDLEALDHMMNDPCSVDWAFIDQYFHDKDGYMDYVSD